MTKEQIKNKELCERYPFLIVRNVWTGKIPEDYDYSYIRGGSELPRGWLKLFYQMCEDIRQPLIDADYLDEFRFSQIKEKYNSMHCYNFGAPAEVLDTIRNYEYVSSFICQNCGAPAKYETGGWITSYCEDCLSEEEKEYAESIEFDPIMHIHGYNKDGEYTKTIDVSHIWNKLYGVDKNA